jgi:RNA polymerase sigma-70 factor (ECF subfamily)
MATFASHEVTQLLVDWGEGDQSALNKLIPLVYYELRRMAHRYMARSHAYAKRGGGTIEVPLNEAAVVSPQRANDVLALDEALNQLAIIDPRKCQIVELRYFGGFTVEETAALLEVSGVTVMRDWSLAKAWLRREIVKV